MFGAAALAKTQETATPHGAAGGDAAATAAVAATADTISGSSPAGGDATATSAVAATADTISDSSPAGGDAAATAAVAATARLRSIRRRFEGYDFDCFHIGGLDEGKIRSRLKAMQLKVRATGWDADSDDTAKHVWEQYEAFAAPAKRKSCDEPCNIETAGYARSRRRR